LSGFQEVQDDHALHFVSWQLCSGLCLTSPAHSAPQTFSKSQWMSTVANLFFNATSLLRMHLHFNVRRHFARLFLYSYLSLGNYWRERSTSTVIAPASASNVVGQHNKTGGVTFGAFIVVSHIDEWRGDLGATPLYNTWTNCTVLSPSWEAASCVATQELPSILRNPKLHCSIHNSLPLVPILN
jgi:hypothetical protein